MSSELAPTRKMAAALRAEGGHRRKEEKRRRVALLGRVTWGRRRIQMLRPPATSEEELYSRSILDQGTRRGDGVLRIAADALRRADARSCER